MRKVKDNHHQNIVVVMARFVAVEKQGA